jgi:bleomycin hydrolase
MPTAQLPATAGTLTPEFLAELREGYQMSASDRACHNAVTNNDINALALNRGVVRGDDGHFSHRIKSKGITDQKKSGRCWMFAGLNVLRPQVIRDHGMAEFEFSTAYLQFWDKLEKANLFLESVIELRDADILDRDWEVVNKSAMEDGGWWNYVVGLIEKYGVVPASAMPETHTGSHTTADFFKRSNRWKPAFRDKSLDIFRPVWHTGAWPAPVSACPPSPSSKSSTTSNSVSSRWTTPWSESGSAS